MGKERLWVSWSQRNCNFCLKCSMLCLSKVIEYKYNLQFLVQSSKSSFGNSRLKATQSSRPRGSEHNDQKVWPCIKLVAEFDKAAALDCQLHPLDKSTGGL